MASADGVETQRTGAWGRLAVALELALVAYAWSWLSQLAARAVGLDAARAMDGGTYLVWVLIATSVGLALVLLALSVRGAR